MAGSEVSGCSGARTAVGIVHGAAGGIRFVTPIERTDAAWPAWLSAWLFPARFSAWCVPADTRTPAANEATEATTTRAATAALAHTYRDSSASGGSHDGGFSSAGLGEVRSKSGGGGVCGSWIDGYAGAATGGERGETID